MKLLVVSHACVTPVNQSFFADVADQAGWDIELVIPLSWNSEYKSNVQASRWKDLRGAIHTNHTEWDVRVSEAPLYLPSET